MTSDQQKLLLRMLALDEGYRMVPYQDTKGIWTWGYGRNLESTGIRNCEIPSVHMLHKEMLLNDIIYFRDFLAGEYEWFEGLDSVRQAALIDMCFMGCQSFKQFKNMIKAISEHDYHRAACEVLNSLYAKQVGQRAHRIAHMLETGEVSLDYTH